MELTRALDLSDPRDLPLYSRAEAARILGISTSTMEGYVAEKVRDGGARVSEPVIRVPDSQDGRLSFNNLVEAYVLNLLRSRYDVSMRAIRNAVKYAESKMEIDRLLTRRELRFGQASDLFWDKIKGDLTNLTRGGQFVMRQVVEDGLRRVEFDSATGLPLRFFPRVGASDSPRKSVVIDPRVAYGRPTLAGLGLPTWAVADRVRAGEDPEAVARDYGVDQKLVADALNYENVV